ncbi:MAG: restriction endonuclease subunit S, partial [Synergistaceae bacterium]|nr:restriction endonuclease subunit S [Synergistaceae bacterium]
KLCPRKDNYPIFLATMQKPSKDNSGDKIFVRGEDGEFKLDEHGHLIVDHDLFNHDNLTQDGIAEAFIEFAKRENLSFFNLSPSFDAERYAALMDGLECSEIKISELAGRMDAEFYSKGNIFVQKKLNSTGTKTIADYGAYLDCSAFYPSIAGYYSHDKDNIPFLRVTEINNGLINIKEDTIFLPEKVLKDNSKTIACAYPGDIIITKGGSIARIGLVTDDFPVYATSRDIIILRTEELQGLNKYFLWAFLYSMYGQKILFYAASQTVQPHLTLPVILAIKVPNVKMSLQLKIENIYKNSVKLKRQSELYYKSAQDALTKALNFKPVKNTSNIAIKDFSQSFALTGRLDAEYYMPKYEDLYNLLDKLNTKRLSEIVNIKKSIEPGSEFYGEDGVPFIRVSDVSKSGINPPSIKIPLDTVPNIARLYPVKDTILLSKDGSVGIAYKLENDIKAVTSGALLHLHVKNKSEILPDYLTLVLNSEIVQLQAERDVNGAIIQHWRLCDIENVIIPVISQAAQHEIAEQVQNSFKLKSKAEDLINKAIKAVELAIEQGEDTAINYINA